LEIISDKEKLIACQVSYSKVADWPVSSCHWLYRL